MKYNIMNYLGSTSRKHLVRRTRQEIRPKTIKEFCSEAKFDVSPKNTRACTNLPHMDTVSGDQVVIGRMRTLAKYKYDKCPIFKALTLPYDYEAKPGNLFWTIKMNDIFMYCAQRRRQRFPIRLVVDPTPRSSKNRVMRSTVTWREEQQLLRFFKMYKYKSLTHKGIFFFSKYKNLHHPGLVRVF